MTGYGKYGITFVLNYKIIIDNKWILINNTREITFLYTNYLHLPVLFNNLLLHIKRIIRLQEKEHE
jgi:hypothetical protein